MINQVYLKPQSKGTKASDVTTKASNLSLNDLYSEDIAETIKEAPKKTSLVQKFNHWWNGDKDAHAR